MTATYTISELASTYGVSTRTIRYYEEIGLIKPERNASGHRYFTKKEKTQLQLIFRGKKYGFHLEEIKEMIRLFDEDPTGREQLKRTIEYGEGKISEVTKRIEELQAMKDEMNHLMNEFQKELNQLEEE
ncbi:MerR family transcriptional regulator [Halalkalibacillus halophilus]|uniref:MerR family transcriptional regulator n=1 Tax=Halalkalibacillus halophilus TaxID=392827 RepID=UPI000411EBC3|nr:MerR family DNA-binding transcriptional regulator [Halalkalibacillus halophilus]